MSIEKFEGTFSKEKLGVTLLPTETIQSITDMQVLAVWTYLASRPDDWIVNPQDIKKHFGIGSDQTAYKILNKVIEIGLLERTIERSNGKFHKYHYHLRLTRMDKEPQPFSKNQQAVNQQAVNCEHTKHRDKQNIEFINNKGGEIDNEHQAHDTKDDWQNHTTLYEEQSPAPNPPLNPSNLPATRRTNSSAMVDALFKTNPHSVPEELLSQWREIRNAKREPITVTAWNELNKSLSECEKNGLSVLDVFTKMVAMGWANIDSTWFTKKKQDEPINVATDMDWANNIDELW